MKTFTSRNRIIVFGVGLTALALVVVAGLISSGLIENEQPYSPASQTAGPDSRVSLGVAEADSFTQNDAKTPIVRSREISLEIDAGDFSHMQISTDITFSDSDWRPAADRVSIVSNHAGYQQIFAQFGDGSNTEAVAQAEVLIKLQPEASTPLKSVQSYGSNAVLLHIENGEITWTNGDSILEEVKNLTVSDLQSWEVDSEAEISIADVKVRSYGLGAALKDGESTALAQFDVVLIMDSQLQPDIKYTFSSAAVGEVDYVPNYTETRTPLIQLSQVGWQPDDQKTVYIGGETQGFNPLLNLDLGPLNLIDSQTNQTVATYERSAKQEGNGVVSQPVFAFDITSTVAEGNYRACVDQLGCSQEFRIADGVWLDVAGRIARASFHQRSGLAFGLPFTTIERPRPRHPDDGNSVLQSGLSLLEAETEFVDRVFEEIEAQATRTDVSAQAWGGHHDAGDWDRRVQHLRFARLAGDLVREHPEVYEALNLRIPESGDDIPDLLDEGLWTIEAYRRMQQPDGAISGGIEATEHPPKGATSWSSELQLYAFEPDAWSAYSYAGVAAEYASLMKHYDLSHSQELEASAISAAAWAESQDVPTQAEQASKVAVQRLVAATALYELTEDTAWHEMIIESGAFAEPVVQLNCQAHELCDAAWIYLRIDESLTKAELRENMLKSFDSTASTTLAHTNSHPYGWTKENPDVPNVWGLAAGGAPKAIGLLRAYKLTGNVNYLKAAQASASFSVGANPLNVSYITGTGLDSALSPLIVDSINGGLPVWPGTPVYGNHEVSDSTSWVFEFKLGPAGVVDDPADQPYLLQWQDVHLPQWTEFTMHSSHGVALYVFGSLGALN